MSIEERPDVVGINRVLGIAILEDNTHIPITHWFSATEEPGTPANAVSCVAGSDETGWYALDLLCDRDATVH